MMKQLTFPVGSSVSGPVVTTQQSNEKPALTYHSTNHQTFTIKNLTSQMREHLPLPVVAATTPLVPQEPSPVTPCIGTTTEPRVQYTSVPANATKQLVTPTSTKVFQASAKPSPVIKSTSSLESAESHKVSAKTAQKTHSLSPAVAFQPPLTPWLTDQQTSSTTVDVASKLQTEQPSKSKYLASSNTPVVQSANILHSSTPVTAKQLLKTSVSQPQIQPTMSLIHPLTVQQAATMMGLPLCTLPSHLQQV